MVATLDERMSRQLSLVESTAKLRGITVDDIRSIPKSEIDKSSDTVLVLCWHIVRDVEYIDGLR